MNYEFSALNFTRGQQEYVTSTSVDWVDRQNACFVPQTCYLSFPFIRFPSYHVLSSFLPPMQLGLLDGGDEAVGDGFGRGGLQSGRSRPLRRRGRVRLHAQAFRRIQRSQGGSPRHLLVQKLLSSFRFHGQNRPPLARLQDRVPLYLSGVCFFFLDATTCLYKGVVSVRASVRPYVLSYFLKTKTAVIEDGNSSSNNDDNSNDDNSNKSLFQRLSIALQRGNAALLIDRDPEPL